jgi:hypothetical protein
MRVFLFLLFLPVVLTTSVAQTDPYASRGPRCFLVNYGAIQGDRFAAELAARRFALIVEAGRGEIPLLHAVRPDLPVLVYKDVVAVYPWMDEYSTVNRNEHAFLHASEPSGLTLWRVGDSLRITWLKDRRDMAIAGYRLFALHDSLAAPEPLDGLLHRSAPVTVKLPDSVRFLLVRSESDTGELFVYGYPVNVAAATNTGEPLWPDSVTDIRSGDTVRLHIGMASLSAFTADSVFIIADWDKSNALNSVTERRRMRNAAGEWTFDTTFTLNEERSSGGYEFRIEAWRDGLHSIFPREGSWHSNINNRLKNDYYGFYVMNVRSEVWRAAFVEQVRRAFISDGYTGLFEDDCWYRVENYGVDAWPPRPYDEHSWRQGLFSMLDSIRSGIAPHPAYFNGLYTVVSDSLLHHTDGGMTEGFAYTHWSGLVPGNNWRNQCNRGLSAMHRYGKTWMALAGAPYDDTAGRLYAIASYLLLDDSLGMYATATSYQEFALFPEFDLPLGKALEHAGMDIDELAQGSGNARWYKREFENGSVIVNPSDTPVYYSDSRARPCVELTVGTIMDGGRLYTANRGDSIRSRSARIYIGSGASSSLMSPLILDRRFEPAVVPADGLTPCRVHIRASDSSSAEFFRNAQDVLRVTLDASAAGGPSQMQLVPEVPGSAKDALWYSASFTMPVGAPADSLLLPFSVESTTGLISTGHLTIRIASADSGNLVTNYSFEIDRNRDGIPDNWRSYVKGFDYDISGNTARSGARSVHVRNDSLTEFRGITQRIELRQTEARPLLLGGWSRCNQVSGTPDNDYALYVDAWYADGTPLYGQAARFSTGTHDWEYSEKLINPEKPISHLMLYLLFRRHTGEAWFDHISLRYAEPTQLPNAAAVTADFDIHPNPARDAADIVLHACEGRSIRLLLRDITGRAVYHAEFDSTPYGAYRLSLPLVGLPSGMYSVQVMVGMYSYSKPLMVVR